MGEPRNETRIFVGSDQESRPFRGLRKWDNNEDEDDDNNNIVL
jgi:hypothetical protein